MLSPKFDIESIMIKKYIKAKVKTFNDIVNKVFWNDKIPKEVCGLICPNAIKFYRQFLITPGAQKTLS